MAKSMTGFGAKEVKATPFGSIHVELRSTNHKFLEIVFHLPEGFLSLEDRLRKEIEKRLMRGRITCVVHIARAASPSVSVNQGLLKCYLSAFRGIQRQFRIPDGLRLDTLVHLPGVLCLEEKKASPERLWTVLCAIVKDALEELEAMRFKEGQALARHVRVEALALEKDLAAIRSRFKKVIAEKALTCVSEEERSSFLRDTDITEEMERLAFHLRNFKQKLSREGPLGKELDFIAQEMQRESNTIGAKSCDALISSRVVQAKSQVEKIREQLQNIE